MNACRTRVSADKTPALPTSPDDPGPKAAWAVKWGVYTAVPLLMLSGCFKPGTDSKHELEDAPRVEGEHIHFSERFAERIDLRSYEAKSAKVVQPIAARGAVLRTVPRTAAATLALEAGTSSGPTGPKRKAFGVELAVYERSLPLIRLGDDVELLTSGDQSERLNGRVTGIDRAPSESGRGYPVYVEVSDYRLKPPVGQAVNAVIRGSGGTAEAGTVVPEQAVTYVSGKPTVFVLDAPGTVRVAFVELGPSDGDARHITIGVDAGERVVTHGAFELKSEFFR